MQQVFRQERGVDCHEDLEYEYVYRNMFFVQLVGLWVGHCCMELLMQGGSAEVCGEQII